MTLRALGLKVGLELKEADRYGENAALAFVLNRPFLPGLKALAYSMLLTKTMIDVPVLIITDEPDLLEEPFVQSFADRTVCVSEADIKAFSNIKADRIDERVKLDWIPAYTYLKWLIFDDYGFDQLIWLDADMLCLKPIDHLLKCKSADLYASAVFPQTLYRDKDGNELPLEVKEENLDGFCSGLSSLHTNMNSGVMVINKALLTPSFRSQLIEMGEQTGFKNEQQVISKATRAKGPSGFAWLEPWDNFNNGFLYVVGSKMADRLLEKIRILHFVGANANPWMKTKSKRKTDALWWKIYNDACSRSEIFS